MPPQKHHPHQTSQQPPIKGQLPSISMLRRGKKEEPQQKSATGDITKHPYLLQEYLSENYLPYGIAAPKFNPTPVYSSDPLNLKLPDFCSRGSCVGL